MTSSTSPSEDATLEIIIFGGAGDLAARKLLPALFMAHKDGKLPGRATIVGIGRNAWGRDQYLEFIEAQSRSFVAESQFDQGAWDGFLARIDYVCLDATCGDDYPRLAAMLGAGALRIFYLATAPALFTAITRNLAAAGMVDSQCRVVLEKPLGHDLASAVAINEAVGAVFAESQIYRIDHYLGKETVQNLMALRFGNLIFEPLWRSPAIEYVQITVAETVGVGTRGGFYDGAGAMRDMVQNHLLQLLCFIAMEPPAPLDQDAVRDEKLKVLRSLRRYSPADVARNTVRGQYVAGPLRGEPAKGYLEEDFIAPDSQTETFVVIRAQVDTWRWSRVPFFLRTGKRMQEQVSEIVISFADVPHHIFEDFGQMRPNRLVIRLQPEESVRLHLMVKEPGDGMRLRPVSLDLDFNETFTTRRADAYERLLLDVIHGRLTLFMRRDELEAAWSWVDTILAGWREVNERPRPYAAGTWGPAASSALIARDNAHWSEEA